ncbi:MAG: O-antigen ligase family protein [Solirubrobacterales bacterium]
MSEPRPELEPSRPGGADPSEAPSAPAVRPEVAIPFLIAALALVGWWGWKQGAYFGPVFYPGAIALFLLIALSLLIVPLPRRLDAFAALALAAVAGLGVWTLASILWTPAPAAALADAQRVFAYAAIFGVGLWTVRLLGARSIASLLPVAIGGTLVGLATVIAIGTGSDFNWYLHSDATLRFPIGYRNANAAFFLTCLWPLIGLATHNEWRWQLRAPMVAAATLLIELAILAQSRGSLPATAIALLVVIVLSPHRLRTAVVLALAAIPTIPALPALLEVYRHGAADPGVVPLLHDAAGAVALSTAGSLLLAAIALGLLYPRLRLGPARVRVISWVAGVAATLAVLAGGAIFIASHGGPVGFVDQRVKEFRKVGYPDLRSQGIRYGANVGSNRHDFYRVGLDQTADHPLLGGGAGSFQFAYLRHRRSGESPRDPHSLIVRVGSELGLPGLALLIAFVVGCLGAAVRSRRRGPLAAALVAAALAGGVQWFVQGCYDWFWQYPGVSAAGFYLLGVAAGPATAAGRRARVAAPARWALAAALVAAALVAVPLFVSDRYAQRGVAEAGSDPDAALRNLGRAADLNPLADQALIERGALAASLGDRALALRSFRDAIERVPDNYASHWFVARELLRSRPAVARAELERARELNPRGPEVRALERRLGRADR